MSPIDQSLIVAIAIPAVIALALTWLTYVVLAGFDVEDGTEAFADKIGGLMTGAVGAGVILIGEAAAIGALLIEQLAATPEVVVALLGFGSLKVGIEPGMFAIGALAAILLGYAVQGVGR